jgi:aryl-alcohol dehydrogenase-like predicted oxidoreductase
MLPKKLLGSTGLEVSVLGLGTVKFGRNQGVKYPEAFEIPDDKHLLNLLAFAKDLGINLLDTAPAYGTSEERLGTLLKKTRKDWVIAGKVGEEFINGNSLYNFTPEYAKMSIERSLKRLNTDYLDAVLVHSDGNDVKNIQQYGLLDFLKTLKKSGMIRSFGVSTKTVEGGLLALAESDMAMVTFNPIHLAEQPVILEAFRLNKGILIKKALVSGHLDQIPGSHPAKTALQFILKEPGVTSIILGTLSSNHLEQNAKAAIL